MFLRALFRAALFRTRLFERGFSALFVLQLTEAHNLQLRGHSFGNLCQLRIDARALLWVLFSGRPRYGFLGVDRCAVKFRWGPTSSAGFALSEVRLAALLLLKCDEVFRLAVSPVVRSTEFLRLLSHCFELQLGLLFFNSLFEGSIDRVALVAISNRPSHRHCCCAK